MMFERLSIVGAGGNVGRALTQAAHRDGWRCRAVTRRASQALEDLPIERAYADLNDPEATRDALTGSNVVVFAASPHQTDPLLYTRRMVVWLRHVLDALEDLQVGRIILPSAVSPFWPDEKCVDPDHRHVADGSKPFVDAAYFAQQECSMRTQAGLDVSIVLSNLLAGDTIPRVSRPLKASASIRVTPVEALTKAILIEARSTQQGARYVFAESEVWGISETSWWSDFSPGPLRNALRGSALNLPGCTGARDDDLLREPRSL